MAEEEVKKEEKERMPGWLLMTPRQRQLNLGWEGWMDGIEMPTDLTDRDALVACGKAMDEKIAAMFNAVPIPEGWCEGVTRKEIKAQGEVPDLTVLKPENAEGPLPCIVHMHGGGMCIMSGKEPFIQMPLAKACREHNVMIVSIHFSNAYVKAYPGALDECVAATEWVNANAEELGVDISKKLITMGDSGGANLAIATAMRLIGKDLLCGVYATIPYISGVPDAEELPSTIQFTHPHDLQTGRIMVAMYGSERTAPAWPYFATKEQLTGFPRTHMTICGCDAFKDEGVAFFNKLMNAGVDVTASVKLGLMHGGDEMDPVQAEFAFAELGVFLKQVFYPTPAAAPVGEEEVAAEAAQ